MRLKDSDAALFVTKDHQLLAEQLHLLWQIVELVRGAHRLPIATQEFTHRASWLDAGQLVVRWRYLPSVSRFHHCLPCTSLGRSSTVARCYIAAASLTGTPPARGFAVSKCDSFGRAVATTKGDLTREVRWACRLPRTWLTVFTTNLIGLQTKHV